MSLNVKDVLQAPILRFDTLESTNNRAAQMIDADKSVAGLTIVASEQTAGKGQRGNVWKDAPGQSLLMSIVLHPNIPIEDQFAFSAAVAVALADAVQNLDSSMAVHIKFPNDIIVNDKKAAGILIENSLRGNVWTHAIVGAGINVHQRSFVGLPHATSLYLATQREFDIEMLLNNLRAKIVENTQGSRLDFYLGCYNDLLYKRGKRQTFSENGRLFEATILNVNAIGQIELQLENGTFRQAAHGELLWVW